MKGEKKQGYIEGKKRRGKKVEERKMEKKKKRIVKIMLFNLERKIDDTLIRPCMKRKLHLYL